MKKKENRIRLDELLIKKGLAEDKKEASALIMSGDIIVNKERIRKADTLVNPESEIEIIAKKYVSRGGEKLEGALSDFGLDVKDFICADIGISTGGFTDCLLKNGAKKVYGFDVGYGVVDYSIRTDKRVVLFERCNFKNFDCSTIKEKMDLVLIDVSFISVRKILPNALSLLKPDGKILILLKPQFEAPKEDVMRGGMMNDVEVVKRLNVDIQKFIKELGCEIVGFLPSRLKGAKGNQEYFILIKQTISIPETNP
ncbi:MAG: TlyA family RNA methyltransferase [Myxococcota bacterium]